MSVALATARERLAAERERRERRKLADSGPQKRPRNGFLAFGALRSRRPRLGRPEPVSGPAIRPSSSAAISSVKRSTLDASEVARRACRRKGRAPLSIRRRSQ
jgi:hypothetical protein